jgi:hypothetical protein
MKKAIALLLLMAMALPAAAWDLTDLMDDLARHKGGRARFIEKKSIALLDKPVVSSGDRLQRALLEPESLVLDGDMLTIERGKQKFKLRLSEQPAVLAFVDSLRGTLSGDRAALEKSYKLTLSGNENHWTLDLLPDDQRIAAFVVRITFGGSHHRVEWIRYLQADGDSSVMTIEPIGEE